MIVLEYYKNCARQTTKIITGSMYLSRNSQDLNSNRLVLLSSLTWSSLIATFLSRTYPVKIDKARQPSGISMFDTKKSIRSKIVFPKIKVSDKDP